MFQDYYSSLTANIESLQNIPPAKSIDHTLERNAHISIKRHFLQLPVSFQRINFFLQTNICKC
jgi:hypothetical protein